VFAGPDIECLVEALQYCRRREVKHLNTLLDPQGCPEGCQKSGRHTHLAYEYLNDDDSTLAQSLRRIVDEYDANNSEG
jgi:hypothetical protein